MPRFDETKHNKKLAELHAHEEEELIRVLSHKYGHQYINLQGVSIDTDAMRLVDEQVARASMIALFQKVNKNK